MNNESQHLIYICSDSVGETTEAVAKATIKQFHTNQVKLKRYSHLQDEDEIRNVVSEAAASNALIMYTLVQPELREMMRQEAVRHNIATVDIMGPAMQGFIDAFHGSPSRLPGRLHTLDEDYYRRIDAIEYTVRNDDGKNLNELLQADIVLLGVSRTSKTPLSIYLSHKGYKTANVPIVPEVLPPDSLSHIDSKRLFGLTMHPEQLIHIREARLQTLGLLSGSLYTQRSRVEQELNHAKQFMEQIGCTIIDVTNRAIEETAGIILESMQ